LDIDFFDTAGTLVAVATQAGIMKDNKLPRAGRALFADSLATIVGYQK
jgi:AGZA family xanthine/uracil permease-like MFS transporter